jgi:hypothetical protein
VAARSLLTEKGPVVLAASRAIFDGTYGVGHLAGNITFVSYQTPTGKKRTAVRIHFVHLPQDGPRKYHIHQYGCGQTTSDQCAMTGNHYDPTKANKVPSKYRCDRVRNATATCEHGDLSGKYGLLGAGPGNYSGTVAAGMHPEHPGHVEAWAQVVDDPQAIDVRDILGKAVVIHGPGNGTAKWLCADIRPVARALDIDLDRFLQPPGLDGSNLKVYKENVVAQLVQQSAWRKEIGQFFSAFGLLMTVFTFFYQELWKTFPEFKRVLWTYFIPH